MKIYLITFNKCEYDQYDAFVVIARDEVKAINLIKEEYPDEKYPDVDWKAGYKIKEIKPEEFKERKIILESFNAG